MTNKFNCSWSVQSLYSMQEVFHLPFFSPSAKSGFCLLLPPPPAWRMTLQKKNRSEGGKSGGSRRKIHSLAKKREKEGRKKRQATRWIVIIVIMEGTKAGGDLCGGGILMGDPSSCQLWSVCRRGCIVGRYRPHRGLWRQVRL